MCGGISEIKKGYQPRKNIVKDEKGDLFTDAYSILDMRRNRLCYFLNIHGFNDVRQQKYIQQLRGELSYLAPLGSENISAPYFKHCFFQGGYYPPD